MRSLWQYLKHPRGVLGCLVLCSVVGLVGMFAGWEYALGILLGGIVGVIVAFFA